MLVLVALLAPCPWLERNADITNFTDHTKDILA
jgi:hypothetical protein